MCLGFVLRVSVRVHASESLRVECGCARGECVCTGGGVHASGSLRVECGCAGGECVCTGRGGRRKRFGARWVPDAPRTTVPSLPLRAGEDPVPPRASSVPVKLVVSE